MDRKIDRIIVHCSDSPNDKNFTWLDINEWHRERGFTPHVSGDHKTYCGYHYVIHRDGVVVCCRPHNVAGIHCTGYNTISLGVCLIGKDEFTKEQMESLYLVLKDLCSSLGIEAKNVFGHYEFNPKKTCPNIEMEKLRDELEVKLGGK